MTRNVTAEEVAAMMQACRTDQERRIVEDMTSRGIRRVEVAQLHGLTEGEVTALLRRLSS